jgi:hypothetical protein
MIVGMEVTHHESAEAFLHPRQEAVQRAIERGMFRERLTDHGFIDRLLPDVEVPAILGLNADRGTGVPVEIDFEP